MRCPRLFPLSLSGLFVLLVSLLLAQSGRVAVGNPPDALAIAQEPRPGTHLTFHQRTQGPLFSQRTIRTPQPNLFPHATSEGEALSFASAVTYDFGGFAPESVAVADVNGDGEPDLIVASQCADNSCAADGSVGVLLGNGDGNLVAANGLASRLRVQSSVNVLLGNGDGTFNGPGSW